jgi:hypothetical protein
LPEVNFTTTVNRFISEIYTKKLSVCVECDIPHMASHC